jgi:hypothetical protein
METKLFFDGLRCYCLHFLLVGIEIIASDGRMNDELERVWEGAVVA